MVLAVFVFAPCVHINPARGKRLAILPTIHEENRIKDRPAFFTPKPIPLSPPKLSQDPRERAVIQALTTLLQKYISMDKDFSIAHKAEEVNINAALILCEKSASLSLALLNLFNHQLGLRFFEFPNKMLNDKEIRLLCAIKEKIIALAKNNSLMEAVTERAECERAQIEWSFRLSAQTLQTLIKE